MPHIEVYCTVNTCDYWGQGNHCFAQKILITRDSAGDQWPDSVDAPQASTLPPTPAENCMATCCKTFRPRDSKRGPVPELLPHQNYLKQQGGGATLPQGEAPLS